jgi:transcriptional regulator of PTS gene
VNKYSSILKNGANQNTIKNANRNLVLEILNSLGKTSRTELAELTGLTKTSITNITTELIEQDIICEVGSDLSMVNMGRKPVMLDISQNSPCALGININRDFVYTSLINLRGDILLEDMLVLHTLESSDSFLQGIYQCCEKILFSEVAKKKKIIGIGVASIGPLNISKGMIVEPPNFKAIKGIKIVELIEQKFNLPVVLNNDMNACAISEKLFGYAKQVSNFVYLGVTNGIGAGIMVNKNLYMGDKGFAGEVGHISIDYKGKKCPCGNIGCFELYAGIPSIEKRANELLKNEKSSLLSTIENVRWLDIIDTAYKNDKIALALLDELIEYLTAGIVAIANAYDPEVIYLGHEIALAGKLIIYKLRDSVNSRVFSKQIKELKIEISKFTDMMYRINGGALVVYSYLKGMLDDRSLNNIGETL